ncbi:2OG-Fe(II) oxygenase [Undibacterium flavidum]|uniref:2OG-Fe(II) oxygenase n=1 Tax=Undibacterium flavidum TaxID=2762297 RepID=A0ABR6Y9S5_9BURK|nr:2OG-Fe(II) oxygenase [Undibacterium flavidum]MBC3873371.1 2OG-Fe(II) oxygenase [Undibacterium flavidum]
MKLVKLEEGVFEIDAFLPVEECDSLIALSEAIGFKQADVQTLSGRQLLTNIRNNERVDYLSNTLAKVYWQKIAELNLPICEGKNAIGISSNFRFYKYQLGQKFSMHRDGRQSIGENETLYTLLVYLNEDCIGGETFFREGNLKVLLKKGLAIIFEHSLWHQGVDVKSGVKYVLRSDIVYGE